MKRFFSLFLIFVILFTSFPINVLSKGNNTIKRYTVLVLDTSDTAEFLNNGTTIYRADTAVNYVKDAAKVFVENITSARGENYVAIVSYKSTAQTVLDFTNDYDVLEREIDRLYSSETTRDISSGLKCADALISKIKDEDAIKNVVLCTTGMTNAGDCNYTGQYDSNVVGSTWYRTDTSVKLYAYANVAVETAKQLKQKATIYTLGIFQTMDGMPEVGHNIVEFFKLTAKDLASSDETFHEVEDFDNIIFAFGDIADDITNQAKAGKFFYESGGKDYQETYYYDDNYFTQDSTNYNSSLATMSLCLALSAFNSSSGGTDSYSAKDYNVKTLLEDELEFTHYKENEWYHKKPTDESIGCAIAQRKIKDDNETYTLIAVAVRGGNYESEWASNFTLGRKEQAQGFKNAKEQVLDFLKNYIADPENDVSGKIKLWITGYSRAGATSNLVAGAIDDNMSALGSNVSLSRENLYAYCFETPMGAVRKDIEETEKYDPNRYKNIHNIINVNDFVTKVAMTDFGFSRYGEDYCLPDKTTTSPELYNIWKEKMLTYYNNMASHSVAKKYIIDDFSMKYLDLRYILPGGKTPTQINTFDKSSQGQFLDTFMNKITGEVITTRNTYVDDYQNSIRIFFMAKYGTLLKNYDLEHVNSFFQLFFEKIKEPEFLSDLLYYTLRNNIAKLNNHIENLITECLNECGMNKINASTVKDLAEALAQILLNVGIKHPHLSTTLISSIDNIAQAHRPELCFAWLKSQDINYTIDPVEFCGTGSYRVIRINCPVDVNVYNSSGSLVAQIEDNESQEVEGSSLVATLNENGEKVIILPIMDEYSIELTATDEGTVSYNISEFCHLEHTNTRVLNYFDIKTEKGDVLKSIIPAYSDSEIKYGTKEGSNAEYELYDADGNLLEPDSDLRGKDAQNAYHTVEVQSNDEDRGVVAGGGVFLYGNFAQLEAVPEKGYKFEGWYIDGELASTESSYRFAVTEDVEIVGKFVSNNSLIGFLKEHLLTILIVISLLLLSIVLTLVFRANKKRTSNLRKHTDATVDVSNISHTKTTLKAESTENINSELRTTIPAPCKHEPPKPDDSSLPTTSEHFHPGGDL